MRIWLLLAFLATTGGETNGSSKIGCQWRPPPPPPPQQPEAAKEQAASDTVDCRYTIMIYFPTKL